MKDARRILVVDDGPGIGLMLTKALARHGFQVYATTSDDEAMEKSEAQSYDAAIVDLVMPGRDGAELSATLRRRFPGLPIGLLTGYGHDTGSIFPVFSIGWQDGSHPDRAAKITGDTEFPETMHTLCAANASAKSLPFSITVE